MRIGVLAWVVILWCAWPVLADTVVLSSGMVVEGDVRDLGDRIEVRVPEGSFTYRKDIVARITKGVSPVQWYDQQAKAIHAGDVVAHLALAQECGRRGLRQQATEQYQLVVMYDKDNSIAHQALGHQQVDGRWLSESDAMAARGYVRLNGKWVTRDVADLTRRGQDYEATVRATHAWANQRFQQIDSEYNAKVSKIHADAAAEEAQRAQEEATKAERQRQTEQWGRYSVCSKCWAHIPDGEHFCPKCNTWLPH